MSTRLKPAPQPTRPLEEAPAVAPAPAQEELLADGDTFFRELIQAIDRAERNIDCEVYIMVSDDVGKRVFAAFERAAQRGVSVRFVVDGFGSASWLKTTDLENVSPNLQIAVYHPVPVMGYYVKNLVYAERTVRALMKLNRRNHKKLVIIDDREVFIGSYNFWCYSLQWKEISLRTQIAIDKFKLSFTYSWSRARLLPGWRRTGRRYHLHTYDGGGGRVRFNFSYRERWQYLRRLNQKIAEASSKVWLMTPYFVPPLPLLKTLCQSASRGIDVRLVLPERPDHAVMKTAARYYYPQLLRSGVKIYEYTPRMLHAKALLVDDWVAIGSSNINHRSFFCDLEIMVTPQHERTRRDLRREFDEACEQSIQLTESSGYVPPWWTRMISYLFLVTRRWM